MKKVITMSDFYTTFKEELKSLEDNGICLTRIKNDGVWNRLYFDANCGQIVNVKYAMIFVSPLDDEETWTVTFEADNCYYRADQLTAIAKFIDALNSNRFEYIVRN